MKKFLAIVMVLCLVFGFCMPISAEAGGIYRLDEAGMTMKVPQDWKVLTRASSATDKDILIQYNSYDEMMNFMRNNDIYVDVLPESNTYISVEMWPADEMIDELYDILNAGSEGEMQSILSQAQTDGKLPSIKNATFYYGNPGEDNNYRYFQYDVDGENFPYREYVIVANGQVLFIYTARMDNSALKSNDIGNVEEFLEGVRFADGRSVAAAGGSTSSSSNTNNVTTSSSGGVKTILLWILAGLVVAGMVVAGIWLFGKKKPNSGAKPVQSATPVTPVAPQPVQPAAPVAPVAPQPVQPAAPVTPIAPQSAAPVTPVEVPPAQPTAFVEPVVPAAPVAEEPVVPVTPVAPQPTQPIEPAVPVEPVAPVAPQFAQPADSVAPAQLAEDKIDCAACGAKIPSTTAFCTECGAKVEKKPVCKNCGAVLEEGAVFCTNCGTKAE